MLGRELIFVTGKGGVGKTTVAAALALGACGGRRDAIVCELGAQGRVAAAFDRPPPPDGSEIELGQGLSSLSIDPDAALAEWIARNVGRVAAAALSRSIERALGGSTEPSLHSAARPARSAWRRAREQSAQLSRLREHVVAPVVELPFLFVPALGPEELGRLAVPLGAALG